MTVRPEPPPLLTGSPYCMTCSRLVTLFGSAANDPERVRCQRCREIDQLRADVARLTEENTRLAREQDIAVSQPSWLCFQCGAVFTDRVDAQEHFGTDTADPPRCYLEELKRGYEAQAERDALRQGIAQLRTWLKAEAGYANPAPYTSALMRLDTLLPPVNG